MRLHIKRHDHVAMTSIQSIHPFEWPVCSDGMTMVVCCLQLKALKSISPHSWRSISHLAKTCWLLVCKALTAQANGSVILLGGIFLTYRLAFSVTDCRRARNCPSGLVAILWLASGDFWHQRHITMATLSPVWFAGLSMSLLQICQRDKFAPYLNLGSSGSRSHLTWHFHSARWMEIWLLEMWRIPVVVPRYTHEWRYNCKCW